MQLLPQRIEEYIAPDDPVRAYDTFVEALDLRELGITLDPHKVVNSEYHPQAMLKLFSLRLLLWYPQFPKTREGYPS